MQDVFDKVMDAVDVETFFVCENENEGRSLSISLMDKLGFEDYDIVFIEHNGPGVRVRLRGFIHKPGDKYGWLSNKKESD